MNNTPLLLLVAALSLSAGRAAAADAGVGDFFNILWADAADPWVYRHTDKQYYATVTTGEDVVLRRSPTLTGIGGGERKVVWTPPAKGPNSKNIWAPEIHRLQGKWYVYYAADDGDNANHRMFVLENDNADPFQGQFIDKGKIADRANDRWAIDGTVLEAGGKLYFLWSGWEGTENVRQNLYIAPMSDPWTLAGERVEISRPTHSWEDRGAPPAINEGPQVLVKGDAIHVVYSASGSWTDHYCLGLLTAKAGSNLLAPTSWRKHAEPVFQSGRGVLAPGHCSFTRSPDDKEDWIVYHSARYPKAGWTRLVRAQPFGWNKDGTPRFDEPALPNVPIALPGGEPKRQRYEAEDAALGGKAQAARHASASRGARVEAIETPESYLEFDVKAAEAGTYNLAVRYTNNSARKSAATHKLTVNGKALPDVEYPYTGAETWSNEVLRVELAAGANKVRFMKGDRQAEIDCLDVFPLRLGKK